MMGYVCDGVGMGINELLEIQQGERRQYHDDISIIIISLEGKIWRSSA
jgi:pyruvate dehydrogenase phosphatase